MGVGAAGAASLGQAFTKKDSKAEKVLSAVSNFGGVPLLVDEGHANVHAYKTVKKVVKKKKLSPKYIKGTLKTLGPAYASYLGMASIPVLTNYIAKKQKDIA